MKNLILIAICLFSTQAIAGPCDGTNTFACNRDLDEKIDAHFSDVREWMTVSGSASARWHLTQIVNNIALFTGDNSRQNFLIGVDTTTIKVPLNPGLSLLDAVQCLRHVKDVTTQNDRGFPIDVKLYKQVECKKE